MHDALAILRDAVGVEAPREVLAVTQKAIASAIKVILRADDSSGIIGDAIAGLLELHPLTASAAMPPIGKLVDWMIKFQFDGEQDFFTIDPVAYAPALGDVGIEQYRTRLAELSVALPSEPPSARPFGIRSHEWLVLEHNAQRLAVLDRDVEAIIRTHVRDRTVARWVHDTAEALAEIGEFDLAIDWAKQAADFDRGHQAKAAAEYWCSLLEAHQPASVVAARHEVFRRWPTSSTAARLHDAAGDTWSAYFDEVLTALAPSPRDAVLFALLTLKDVELAWTLAHNLALQDADAWERLTKVYEKVDPLAVLPVLTKLVDDELRVADAQQYRRAARRLKRMRQLASGTDKAADCSELTLRGWSTYRMTEDRCRFQRSLPGTPGRGRPEPRHGTVWTGRTRHRCRQSPRYRAACHPR